MSLGYAYGKLVQYLGGAKEKKWRDVVEGMLSGAVKVGSRKSTKYPEWATTEVAQGGFATGKLVSALQPDDVPNSYWLTDDGREKLEHMYESGRYHLECPENGALLVVHHLLAEGRRDEAGEILDMLTPYFGEMRFYPHVSAFVAPAFTQEGVYAKDAKGLVRALLRREERSAWPKEYLWKLERAVTEWGPLVDQLRELLNATCVEPPRREGKVVVGGDVFQQWVEDPEWKGQCKMLLGRIDQLWRDGPPRESVRMVRRVCTRVVRGGEPTDGDRRMVREVLASWNSQAQRAETVRAEQVKSVKTHHAKMAYAKVGHILEDIVGRSAVLPESAVSELMSVTLDTAVGTIEVPVGERLATQLRACTMMSLADHIGAGTIPSAEALAVPVQQLTANCNAPRGTADNPALARLWGQLYLSFRARRSVLLLNYERQVGWKEVPWMAVLTEGGLPHDGVRARAALEEVVTRAVAKWPYAIIPNKLLQELQELVKKAMLGDDVVLTEELAADIFMGGFTPKFVKAARLARDVLRGTVYERYYNLQANYGALASHSVTVDEFNKMCERLAEHTVKGTGRCGYDVAYNGAVIEGCMKLTTHGLAQLWRSGLLRELDVLQVLKDIYTFVAKKHAVCSEAPDFWSVRYDVKDMGYAWRNMVFFLACLPKAQQDEFIVWAKGHADIRPLKPLARAVSTDHVPPPGDVVTAWGRNPQWL